MYARLVSWDVENFMSIEKGHVEFDDRNIINFKGYNDSGKSAMLTALKVLMTNCNPSKQVGFIKDEKDYFRVLASFEDGVQILRDKYINGQSLYEMYKDGQLIYSTKSGNALSKVTEVPQPIADYLGLIEYDGTCLNSRSCFELQIGVQTSGSENYKMFNTVLKSEEIASAATMLNNDRNKLASDINVVSTQLDVQKSNYKKGLTAEMVDGLKRMDASMDVWESRESDMRGISEKVGMVSSMKIYPELSEVGVGRLLDLDAVCGVFSAINAVRVTPELGLVDSSRLSELSSVTSIYEGLKEVSVVPELSHVNYERLSEVCSLADLFNDVKGVKVCPEVSGVDSSVLFDILFVADLMNDIRECGEIVSSADENLKAVTDELERLREEVKGYGVSMVKCPGCGLLFEQGTEHEDS